MARTWVLVAESSRARIFESEQAAGPIHELASLEHPEARMHERDLTSDLPGRALDSKGGGGGRHGYEQHIGPKEEHAIRFAKELADRLEDARVRDRFDRVILAAAPKFLGLIRDHLSSGTAALVTEELPKNLVQQSPDEIRKHLPDYL